MTADNQAQAHLPVEQAMVMGVVFKLALAAVFVAARFVATVATPAKDAPAGC